MVRNKIYAALALALAAAACEKGNETPELDSGISVRALVANDTDVRSMRYDIVRCDGTNPMAVVRPLEDQAIPGNVPNFQNQPLDSGSEHLFVDLFQVLPAGCYNIFATPLDENLAASMICAQAFKSGVLVTEAQTTEVFMISQCRGVDPGAVDVIVALNREPVLEDVSFSDSKFVCGSPGEVCAEASDPDSDPLEFVLQADPGCTVVATAIEPNRACWNVSCPDPRRVDLTVQVYDLLHAGTGSMRIEDFLAAEGYPNESHAELSFFAYFDGVQLYVDADGDGFGDENAETTLFCEDDDTTGFVDNNDDCDDAEATTNPAAEEICDDQVDNDCDGEIDESCFNDPPNDVDHSARGAGLASAGVGLASRQGPLLTSATINLGGIPAGATVERAFLYWMIIGNSSPDPTIEVDGTNYVGSMIFFGADTCWGRQGNALFAIDVTTAVAAKGNGAYVLTGFPANEPNGDDGQGASLFVFYADPADTATNRIRLLSGLGVINATGAHMASTFSGLNFSTFTSATLHNSVGDGQPFNDQLVFNGFTIDGNDAFPGNLGQFWDNRIDDVTGLVSTSATSVTTDIHIDPGSDCLAWGVNALVVRNHP